MASENHIEVSMFGRFKFTCNNEVLLGASNKFTQNEKIIAMMICFGELGVTTGILKDEILEKQNVTDVSHSLQSILYNTKKKLVKHMGADVVPFKYKKQKYYWNIFENIEVDIFEFENKIRLARNSSSDSLKYENYLQACYLYKGDFLAEFNSSIWAIGMANKYRDMFADAVTEASDYMRKNALYDEMEKLGHYAAEVDPLSDWEVLTMEALVLEGNVEKARAFYEQTCDYYLNEQGLRPSEKLVEFLKELGNQFSHHTALLDEIYDSLSHSNNQNNGGYVCAYPVFEGIYHVMERMTSRLGVSVYLMLCTVVDGKGNPMKDGPALSEMSERLFDAIKISVRKSDVINKYGKGQFLILLTNVSRENCTIIQKRINNRFRMGRQRTEVLYYLKSVIYTSEEAEQENLLRKEDPSS